MDLTEFCDKASRAIISCFEEGGKVLVCGNGGSATQADHLAEELLGKFEKKRYPLPALSLTNPSVITAIGNDFGFEYTFSRQVDGLGQPNDILITISTSGTSPNVVKAQRMAKKIGMIVIKFPTNKQLKSTTAYTQEVHLGLIHDICRKVEDYFA